MIACRRNERNQRGVGIVFSSQKKEPVSHRVPDTANVARKAIGSKGEVCVYGRDGLYSGMAERRVLPKSCRNMGHSRRNARWSGFRVITLTIQPTRSLLPAVSTTGATPPPCSSATAGGCGRQRSRCSPPENMPTNLLSTAAPGSAIRQMPSQSRTDWMASTTS